MKHLSRKEKALLFSGYLFNPIKCIGGSFRPNENSKDFNGQLILSPSILADCWEGTFNFEDFRLQLKKLEEITDELLSHLWPVIGGTLHLFEWGKDELKEGLIAGNWEESTLQLDYFTLEKMLQKLRGLGFDLDEMIEMEFANEIKL